jgi:hypothetical protein
MQNPQDGQVFRGLNLKLKEAPVSTLTGNFGSVGMEWFSELRMQRFQVYCNVIKENGVICKIQRLKGGL